jgi:hypothetical protein
MMRVLFALLLSLTALSAAHAGAPKKLWELKGFDAPESVVFDPASNALYVSNIGGKIWQKDGDGFIAKVSPDGKMIERQWLTGLSSPTGLALDGGKLYVADIDQLVEIDIASKAIAKRYPAPGAKWFNDVASDGKGVVYVSDSATNTIWRLKDGKLEAWLTDDALNAPNGLHVEDDTLLVAPFGAMAEKGKDAKLATLLKVSLSDKSIKKLGTGLAFGNLDGIEPDRARRLSRHRLGLRPPLPGRRARQCREAARSSSGDCGSDLSAFDQDHPHSDDAGQRACCLQIGVGASKFLWIGAGNGSVAT